MAEWLRLKNLAEMMTRNWKMKRSVSSAMTEETERKRGGGAHYVGHEGKKGWSISQ